MTDTEDTEDTSLDAGIALVNHVVRARDDVPAASRARTADLLLDTIGAALAGQHAEGIVGIREVVSGWGGRPDARVLGTQLRVPAAMAALVNSAQARAMELDDVHEKALVHATATTVPVALAVAEQVGGISGRQVLDAVTLTNDIACRLALAVDMELGGSDHRPRVMSLTYQTAVLAGSLTAGLVAGLDRAGLIDCLGLAYSQVAGNLQGLFEGSLSVRLQQGVAAQAAVQAMEFARAGIDGAHQPLEGRAGWYNAFFAPRYGYSRQRLLADLGRHYLGDDISIKPYACCKYGHNAITAAIDVHAELQDRAVEDVVVRVGRDVWDIICDPLELKASATALGGEQGLALAQFSLPFMVATALLRGRFSVAELDASWRSSAQIADLLPRVRVELLDETVGVEMIPEPGRVAVRLVDGSVLDGYAERTPGHPERRLDTEALHEKFRMNARHLGDARTQELIATLIAFDDLDDVSELTALTAGEPTRHLAI